MIDDAERASVPGDERGGGHMTLWEHLAELRSRIVKCIVAVMVGAVAGWILFSPLLDFLQRPYCELAPVGPTGEKSCALIATGPLDAFTLRLQMSIYVGIALAMPVLLWQLWRFITPGLHPHEKKYAIPFTAAALVLFLFGAAIAYLTLNPALKFLIDIGGGQVTPLYTADSYVKLIVFMMLAFGAGFEFPVLLVALQVAGIVTPRQLSSWRRYAIVIITIVAAVITPSGDPISMLALAIPMYLFFEASIVIGWLFNRRKRKKADKAGARAGGAEGDT
jgi:sec-independent protein translocase protein TatC